MSLGDLTIQDIGRRCKIDFHKHMTWSDFVSAWKTMSPILKILFPAVWAAIQAFLSVLDALNQILETIQQIYVQVVKILKMLKKVILTAVGVLTGNPTTAQQTSRDAQKKARDAAWAQAKKAFDTAVTKLCTTPIRTLSGGAIP